MMRHGNRRGQSMVELGILFAIVIGGLMAMRVYVQRGFQDRLKTATDYRDPDTGFGGDGQYEPKYIASNMESSSTSDSSRQAEAGGEVTAISLDEGTNTGVENTEGL